MTRRLVLGVLALAPFVVAAEEAVDLAALTRIRDEGLHRSQVMETAAYLCDMIGPRLTKSPSMKRANDWTRERFESWGLVNAHLEGFPFGVGWSFERASVHMIAPQVAPLHALPKAWAPGTNGSVRAKAVLFKLASEEDFAAAKGKLEGKIVLVAPAREVKGEDKPPLTRYSEKELLDLGAFEIPALQRIEKEREDDLKSIRFRKALNRFLEEEKAAAALEPSAWEGVLRVQRQGGFRPGEPRGVPTLVMLAEHYSRLARLLDRQIDVELEVDVKASFHEEDTTGYSTIAEIPGVDKKGEVVLAGAHLDSWHTAAGATDNAAGVAAVMEAARILKALGVKPRRTIRFALWSGEEQSHGGAEAYVAEHFGSWTGPEDAEERALDYALQRNRGHLVLKPDHAALSAYFNLDNGTGKIRGIYAEENAAVGPVFEAWIRPLADLGVTAVTQRRTTQTDHEAFNDVGLPGFQFIQDDVEYSTRTWHTNLDHFDRLKREDLMQAAVVMASFLYNAAMRDEKIPRRPLPQYP